MTRVRNVPQPQLLSGAFCVRCKSTNITRPGFFGWIEIHDIKSDPIAGSVCQRSFSFNQKHRFEILFNWHPIHNFVTANYQTQIISNCRRSSSLNVVEAPLVSCFSLMVLSSTFHGVYFEAVFWHIKFYSIIRAATVFKFTRCYWTVFNPIGSHHHLSVYHAPDDRLCHHCSSGT